MADAMSLEQQVTKEQALDGIMEVLSRFNNLLLNIRDKSKLTAGSELYRFANFIINKDYSSAFRKLNWTIFENLSSESYEKFLLKCKKISDQYELDVRIPANIEVIGEGNFEKIIDDKVLTKLPQNTITKINVGGKISYTIEYDRKVPILNFIDNDNKESSVIDKSKDLYRNFADALGIQDKIGNDELKEAMLDNEYCFVENVGWLKQSEYNQHLLGIRESGELSGQNYQYGIYNNLKNAITNHRIDYIDALSEEKANESTKRKWKELINKNETTTDNFELKVLYKGSEKKLRVYYRIKGDDSSKIEILCIDALSSVLARNCPVGSDLNLSPKKAKPNTICTTSSTLPSNNNRYYIPKIFPCNNNSSPWHINGISSGKGSSDFGLWKIETDAYQMVNVWEYDYEEELWRQTDEMVRDEGYLIHGGDGSSRDPQQYNEIDKLKGNNRYYTTTRGCIRVNNKDVVLLKSIFENNLPIELEVKP